MIAKNFEQAKHFILADRDEQIEEQNFESEYFKQQLYNEVRRTLMLDYMSSREQFLDVGEQFSRHLQICQSELTAFNKIYHDANKSRNAQDTEFLQSQFIGEELDWKMLNENMELFESEINIMEDLQGFNINQSFNMDQSIHRGDADDLLRSISVESILNGKSKTSRRDSLN